MDILNSSSFGNLLRTLNSDSMPKCQPTLTEKARAGAFSRPMLMALIRTNLRKGSQKMRA